MEPLQRIPGNPEKNTPLPSFNALLCIYTAAFERLEKSPRCVGVVCEDFVRS